LVGEACSMQCGPQEVAARVAGEDAPGPIAAVGRGREPDDQDARRWIAEAGQRPRPVRLAREPSRRLARRLLAPGHEPRTPNAVDDLGFDGRERGLYQHCTVHWRVGPWRKTPTVNRPSGRLPHVSHKTPTPPKPRPAP